MLNCSGARDSAFAVERKKLGLGVLAGTAQGGKEAGVKVRGVYLIKLEGE